MVCGFLVRRAGRQTPLFFISVFSVIVFKYYYICETK
jgi:hypothetical protein